MMQSEGYVFDAVRDEIQKTLTILTADELWRKNCHQWLRKILSHEAVIQSAVKKLQIPPYFNTYVSITQIGQSKPDNVVFDLRYRGQNIAHLIVNPESGEIKLDTTPFADTTSRDFGYGDSQGFSDNWNGEKAAEFKQYFAENPRRNYLPKNNAKNEEHRVEASLLKEFSKAGSEDKQILYIQPVKFEKNRQDEKGNVFFAMSTQIAASKHGEPKKSKGGIDILARTKHGNKSYLTVIEVKDENITQEGPTQALMQAGAYAAFLQLLLRGEDGEDWWKWFGFGSKLPPEGELVIRIASAMPYSEDNQRDLENLCGIGARVPIGDTEDQVELHTIFFQDDGDNLTNMTSTFHTKLL